MNGDVPTAATVRACADEIVERIAAEDARVLELDPRSWTTTRLREPFRDDPRLRREALREAALDLAGVLEGGPDRLGHVSDWLRNHYYLYGELRPKPRERVIALAREAWHAALAEATRTAGGGPARARAALEGLHHQLPAAVAAFECLPELNRLPDYTGSGAERYWDESARTSARFTIDWASFGREDLFDHNGWRAARWLRGHGFTEPAFHVLQIGCGAGRIEKHLADAVARVTGVDISGEMVRLARARLLSRRNVTITKSDGRSIDVPDSCVDTVFSFLVFIHIHDPSVAEALVREAFRVLRPGGRFLLTLLDDQPELESHACAAGFHPQFSGRADSRWINSFSHDLDRLLVFRRP